MGQIFLSYMILFALYLSCAYNLLILRAYFAVAFDCFARPINWLQHFANSGEHLMTLFSPLAVKSIKCVHMCF